MKPNYIPTGNTQVSLPQINEQNAAIEDITFLHMGLKGLVDIRGDEQQPLMRPFVKIGRQEQPLTNLFWQRKGYWVPTFNARCGALAVLGTILAPVNERGFIYRLTYKNTSDTELTAQLGLVGRFASAWHCINEDKQLNGTKKGYHSNWNHSIVLDFTMGSALFSLAPMASREVYSDFTAANDAIDYTLSCEITLKPAEEQTLEFFWGIGFEEVASCTSAKEMLRQGWAYEYTRTLKWLKQRAKDFNDDTLNQIYNLNLFFNLFYATGVTIDTEELVLVTSRSPLYYVSAAYWDRDSLLWSFPAVLNADEKHARAMLDYVFTRQIKNVGVHSRYIDGTVLEPGFELDELCAPVLALAAYFKATGDAQYLKQEHIVKGINHILAVLEEKKHPSIHLYETFLQPTDDMHIYRYLTYDNVLVWRILKDISAMFADILPQKLLCELSAQADRVQHAIFAHCVKTEKGKRIFCWSTDLDGHYDIYDEPPGSLQLLAFRGFCQQDDEVFQNTVELIRSGDYQYSFAGFPIAEIGCPHAPHPWILSVANSLILGRKEHCRDILSKTNMDNGIACESVNEVTGECETGAAFATCAGFLAYAIHYAYER